MRYLSAERLPKLLLNTIPNFLSIRNRTRVCQWLSQRDRVTPTWMLAVALGGEKTGGLSLTSDTLMLTVTVEDMAGDPLSNAWTEREYFDTYTHTHTH